MKSKIGNILVKIIIIGAGVLASKATLAMPTKEEPIKFYYFAGWDGPMIEETIELIGERINSWQEAKFQKCILAPTYSCSRNYVVGISESPSFGITNGEANGYIFKMEAYNQNRNIIGVVSSHISPAGSLAGQVRRSCPNGYDALITPKGSRETVYECFLRDLNAHKNKGPADYSCPWPYGGNPINFAIGNKYQKEIDFQPSGQFALEFGREYNSLDGYWRHNYSAQLELNEDVPKIYLTKSSGQISVYNINNGVAISEGLDLGKLSKLSGNWVYTSKDNDQLIFNGAGKLLQKKYTNGLEQNLSYTENKIIVTDNFGGRLEFTQDSYGQPLNFNSDLVQVVYRYNSVNKLIQVEKTVAGEVKARIYHYEDSRNVNLLTGITDERGVRFATWAYDDKGRAISSEHAGGVEKIQISYNPGGSSTVTNELGKKSHYRFQTILGLRRIISVNGEPSANCPNSNSTFTYNNRALLTSRVDNKGNRTTYTYNTRGLEVSRTEAVGTPQARTVTTDWHPTLFLPATVTEPGRIITYTYDAQGRQLSQSVTQR